jgi:adenine specific DNA methylase Mod
MYKQKFYSALEKQFVGEEIQGESGFVNLMKIKKEYYDNIKSDIKYMIDEQVSDADEEKEIFEKLYTFFDSYLNETGTPFFNDTQIHKNLYEKVYSDKEDVSLFWKTEDLYYVKTEKNYSNVEIEKEGYKYIFDASEIENKSDNNKKDIGFYLVKADKENKILNFKIKYQQQNSYDKLKEILKIKSTTKLQDFLINDFNNASEYSTIKFNDDLEIRNIGNKSVKRRMLDIREKEDTLTDLVTIDFAAEGLDDICDYLINRKDFDIKREDIKEVFATYARQDKIDYFIHKNAENFLKEQFKQYLFNYIYDNEIVLENEGLQRAQQLNKLKKIAFNIIEYIAKFENELKEIWEKPKFVRKSNYVFTLDKLKDDISLIKKIIKHAKFNEQIEEWNRLYNSNDDSSGKEIKKQWDEFNYTNNFDKANIIKNNQLNEDYKKLIIDTKYFNDIKEEIADYFENLEQALDGYLIKSDNFQALNTLKTKYKNKLDIIYIDPPFNTGSDFKYIDGYQDSTWLTLLENRLFLIKELLKENGTFYLHLDDNANDLGKVLSKDIFKKHINDIIWSYRTGGASKKSNLPKKHDFILSFTNSKDYEINPLTERQYLEKSFMNSKKDKDGNYYVDTLLRNTFEGVLNIVKDDNKIVEYNTRPVLNLSNEFLSFRTQKPEGLLFLLIDIIKNNNIIMDCFAGSGTTLAAAHKLNKKWLGVEMGEHFYDVLLPRLKRVLAGDKSGISDEVDWSGGGFFKYYELESYEDILKRAKYKQNRDELNKYSFMSDEKMLDALELDYKQENIKVKFENLYSDIDIAETLSNLFGKKIKKLNDKRVIFEDGKEIIFDEMTFEKYPEIKPLIWWGEVDNG